MCSFNLRKFFSPTPRTFISSSIFLNGPFFWRYSTMRAAVLAPMPGRLSSSPALAVLILIGDVSAGLAAERDARDDFDGDCDAVGWAAGAAANSAVTATSESTVRNME